MARWPIPATASRCAGAAPRRSRRSATDPTRSWGSDRRDDERTTRDRMGSAGPDQSQVAEHADRQHVAVRLVPGPLVVALVVVLGRVERGEGSDLRGDGPLEPRLGTVP